jgi:hypothetical protein
VTLAQARVDTALATHGRYYFAVRISSAHTRRSIRPGLITSLRDLLHSFAGAGGVYAIAVLRARTGHDFFQCVACAPRPSPRRLQRAVRDWCASVHTDYTVQVTRLCLTSGPDEVLPAVLHCMRHRSHDTFNAVASPTLGDHNRFTDPWARALEHPDTPQAPRPPPRARRERRP